MSFRALAYLICLILSCFSSIFCDPFIGIITYLVTYNISPAGQWWGGCITDLGIDYGKLIAASIILGLIFHGKKIKNSHPPRQSLLLILFIALIWISHFLGLPAGVLTNQHAIKMTKVLIVLLLFCYIVDDVKKYNILIIAMLVTGFYLGYAVCTAPQSMFIHGRFNGLIGGPDFQETNFLAAHFAMLLPFIATIFLKGGWKVKSICLVATAVITNAIVLTGSRGVFLSLLGGFLVAVVFAMALMKDQKRKILVFTCIGAIGCASLFSQTFLQRISSLEVAYQNPDEMDDSAQGRILAWKAAFKMIKDYPLGIGEGNFSEYVGRYDERLPGKDTHNTYFRCLAELGIQGLLVFVMLIFCSFNALRKTWNNLEPSSYLTDFHWHVYALTISLTMFLTCGFFITQTYVEELYWLLLFPVILERCLQNAPTS